MSRNGRHSLEARIGQIGREIFARARGAEPSPLHRAWWQRLLLDWVMQDEALKTQLFRFIESMPRLHSSQAVAARLRECLRDDYGRDRRLPGIIDFATSYASDDTPLARSVAWSAQFGAKQMARQFIAGSTASEAIAAVQRLRREGQTFTIDVLGETVHSSADADRFARTYLDLIDAMAQAAPQWEHRPVLDDAPFGPLPRVNISIKLSALTQRFDPAAPDASRDGVLSRLRPILHKARRAGIFVNVDLEHYAVKDLTFDLFMGVMSEPDFRDWNGIGVVVQAYLRDSEADLRRLLDWARRRGTPITVRLVKGAYWDSETALARREGRTPPVWSEKWQSDAQYERLAAIMLDNTVHLRPAFASHNVRSLAAVLAMSEARRLPPRTLEVQMLYGMGDPLKEALTQMQQRVRIYTPFGELMPGMAYFVRRLLENTANESFLRQTFSENIPESELLAAPGTLEHI